MYNIYYYFFHILEIKNTDEDSNQSRNVWLKLLFFSFMDPKANQVTLQKFFKVFAFYNKEGWKIMSSSSPPFFWHPWGGGGGGGGGAAVLAQTELETGNETYFYCTKVNQCTMIVSCISVHIHTFKYMYRESLVGCTQRNWTHGRRSRQRCTPFSVIDNR